MMKRTSGRLIFGLLAISSVAHAGGNPANGEIVFRKCVPCHSAEKGVNKVGPSVYGVFGQPPASLASFSSYSAAMKAFAATGQKWDEATLAAYLRLPKALVPGTNMAFAGLKKDEDIDDVIAYLRSTNARQ